MNGFFVEWNEGDMARIKDVAALAGVNRSTVSRIINGEGKFREETRIKVEQAMDGFSGQARCFT